MSSCVHSAAIVGIDAVPIRVEADVSRGLPNFAVVGLPDSSVKEARERVRSAIKNSGLRCPGPRLTINLAPADIKKEGPAYDLPIAVALLQVGGVINEESIRDRLFVGELALDGSLRPVVGALPIALMASARGFSQLFVPTENSAEAALAPDVTVYSVPNLAALVLHLSGERPMAPSPPNVEITAAPRTETVDFSFIKGQASAKRAIEIAAAGGHNVLLTGPPGGGKTLLARALPGILPAMHRREMFEVTKISSVCGLVGSRASLVSERPFRSPHHTASGAALIGGGSWPRPGEVSLAHRGVLFLDELPEFSRSVLENLRQPLEDGEVTIARSSGSLKFPAKFMLVAARNPCPCGFAGDEERPCECSPHETARYGRRISGPLLDRIDLCVDVPRLRASTLFAKSVAETSAVVRERVRSARAIQEGRYAVTGIFTNAELTAPLLPLHCPLSSDIETRISDAASRLRLSARAIGRTIKLSRTIADLAGAPDIALNHVAEALHYRGVFINE